MNPASNEPECLGRATTLRRGDAVELTIDVGDYRIAVGFDSQTHAVSSSSVEDRVQTAPQRALRDIMDEPDQVNGGDQWEAAGGFIGKATSLGKAVWSKWLYGPLTGAKLDFRVQCCFGKTMAGVPVGAPCPSLVVKGDNSFCRSCGCGNKHKRAQLNPQVSGDYETSKLAHPDLSCPRDRFVPWKGDE